MNRGTVVPPIANTQPNETRRDPDRRTNYWTERASIKQARSRQGPVVPTRDAPEQHRATRAVTAESKSETGFTFQPGHHNEREPTAPRGQQTAQT